MINFCFDKIIDYSKNIVYPNLADDISGDFYDVVGLFSQTYPYSDMPRLLSYLTQEDIDYNIYKSTNCPVDSFYFININFFDHSVDWFSRMSPETLQNAQQKKFKILFFYCEGDSPQKIKNTLYKSAKQHSIDTNQIHFISHTTIADHIKNFYYFNDDEILYKNAQNYTKSQSYWHNNPRDKKFTCLMRSHKNWRLIVASEFYNDNLHKDSYFSYHMINFSDGFDHIDDFDNIDQNQLWISNAQKSIDQFTKIIPIAADNLSDDEHNDYETHVDEFYTNAYWNIVCETHLNLDGTTGTFITEKTWKPIRHQQPFVIIGTFGTLKHLQDLGYMTFDGIIDESYDYIKHDRSRYEQVQRIIHNLASKSNNELQEINQQVKPIVEHNSTLFNASKKHRLEELINKLLSAS